MPKKMRTRTPEELALRAMRKKSRRLKAYGKRNRRLVNSGLADSYREYLDSPRWALIRAAIMERDNNTCQMCFKPAGCVHHNNYSRAILEGRSINGAFALCHGCHKFIEFDKHGEKQGLHDVRKSVRLLAWLKGRKFVYPAERMDQRAKDIHAALQKKLAELN
jgi:hypothetical protein